MTFYRLLFPTIVARYIVDPLLRLFNGKKLEGTFGVGVVHIVSITFLLKLFVKVYTSVANCIMVKNFTTIHLLTATAYLAMV